MSNPALAIADPTNAPALPSLQASLVFTERTAEKPYAYTDAPPEGVAANNHVTQARSIRIENARAIADTLSLDVEGVTLKGQPAWGP